MICSAATRSLRRCTLHHVRQGQGAMKSFSSESQGHAFYSMHAVQLQQELALRQIIGGKVSTTREPVNDVFHKLPGPEKPHCDVVGGEIEVSWEADQFASSYTLRHLGKATNHIWNEVAHDDFQFNDGH